MPRFGDEEDAYYRHPHLPRVSQVDVPQAGGWIYQFNNNYGPVGYVFVPNMGQWASAIADAIAARTSHQQPVSIGLDLSRFTDVTQQPPKRR